MFLCVCVVYCLSNHTKLIIVEGEGEQLLEKFKVQNPNTFCMLHGFFSLHSISHQKKTAYGQTAEHKCYLIKLSHA